MQMICALLIFQTPELPAPLWHLSPWLDHLVVPPDVVYARLAEQPHRRFIKTHTPLDGIPLDPRVTYIVTARHPLDTFVSFRRQIDNMDRAKMQQLTGQAIAPETSETLHDSMLRWIEEDADPRAQPDSLPGMMHHFVRRLGEALRAERGAGALRRPVRRPRGTDARHRLAARDRRSRSRPGPRSPVRPASSA